MTTCSCTAGNRGDACLMTEKDDVWFLQHITAYALIAKMHGNMAKDHTFGLPVSLTLNYL